ncbi:MAG: ATP-binding protein [Desulfotomaculaceae bacterium]|nr:ATP-binding protein [Desulfotomaculaceae bacterium]
MAKLKNSSGLRLIKSGKSLPTRQASSRNKLKFLINELEIDRLYPATQDEKELARLDCLKLVEEIAVGIGHEIRNPLTTVRGFLQLYRKKSVFLPYKDSFALMIEELDRANSIITEFLSLAKNQAVNIKPQNLNIILANLAPLYQVDKIVINKHINLQLGEIPELPLDDKEVRQLILNLVRNSLKAMSSGGVLTIRTYLDGQEVVLSLQNQGKGIDPDLLEKFDPPFFTTKDSETGLGLAVCYGIAARHNANINIETGLAGTTIFVRFKIPHKKTSTKNFHVAR